MSEAQPLPACFAPPQAGRAPDRGLALLRLFEALYPRQAHPSYIGQRPAAKAPDRGPVRRSPGALRALFGRGATKTI